jgi:hypothetical protein
MVIGEVGEKIRKEEKKSYRGWWVKGFKINVK